MKRVLQINTVYNTGSVGRIMAGLYDFAQKDGYDPYVAFSRSDVPDGINGYRIGNKIDFLEHVSKDIFFDKSGFGSEKETEKFIKWIDRIKPDIIHLHNIHGFYIQVEVLFDYIKKKNIPVIWTFHDCWPMTGHCASIEYIDCDKWQTGCEHCPQHLQSYPYSITDNSRENYKRKKAAFTYVENMTIVTPSKWLAGKVKLSYFSRYPIDIIPNGIDTDMFRALGNNGMSAVKDHRHIILGVANVWTDRKGLKYFEQLADIIDDSYVIYIVGVNSNQLRYFNKRYAGRIQGITHTESINDLVNLYNNALCYVNLTLEDNFPTTNLEALACGTPVITFRTGGSPESIDEGTCGYVVDKGRVDLVYEKIELILSKGKEWYSENCRNKALQYSKGKRFGEYIELYDRILENVE